MLALAVVKYRLVEPSDKLSVSAPVILPDSAKSPVIVVVPPCTLNTSPLLLAL